MYNFCGRAAMQWRPPGATFLAWLCSQHGLWTPYFMMGRWSTFMSSIYCLAFVLLKPRSSNLDASSMKASTHTVFSNCLALHAKTLIRQPNV